MAFLAALMTFEMFAFFKNKKKPTAKRVFTQHFILSALFWAKALNYKFIPVSSVVLSKNFTSFSPFKLSCAKSAES